MPNQESQKISRWSHYKRIKAWRYVACCALAIGFFTLLAMLKGDWSYFERSGGVVVLCGALLGLRKFLRKGAREFDTPNEPLVINGNQFNVRAMWQQVEDLSDSFAQELGLALVVLGTLINTVGAPLLQLLVPLRS